MQELAFLLEFAGEAALLLWGLHMVQTGVQRAFGTRLRAGLSLALGTRRRAFLAGLVTTFALQSSTATALMVAGFAASGSVALAPALAAVAGANLGTAILVPLLSLDTGPLAFGLILAGVAVFRRRPSSRLRDLGRVAIGLGLILLALHMLTATLTPIEQSPGLRAVLGAMEGRPLLFVLVAAVLAWAAHSSLAGVLLVASLAASGSVATADALAMVLGANLGSALNPLIESASGPAGRRMPLGNLLNRLAGVALGLALLPWLAPALAALELKPATLVALAHLLFNVATGLLFLPFLPALARRLERLLPDPPPGPDPGAPRFLDRAALRAPSVALAQAQREVLRMAEMIEDRIEGRETGNGAATGRLQSAIHAYLSELPSESLGEEEARRAADLRHFAQVLDHTMLALEADLLKPLARRRRAGEAGEAVLRALRTQMQLALTVMVLDDATAARRLVEAKEELREANGGEVARELARGLRVVTGQLAAIAHPLLLRRGELLPTRLVGGLSSPG
ncbi:Na/Pi cotransporter family protein [Sabulicella rubraurantiaca]|uniref:Na/Pi cotransporter family protein n=1 Tax=Sabulicella rubraurantiaca TaxID=2811429 RepID=UPI001A95F22D|nr:Na/Pi symporter [Sabulicella rubraurantiaca]